ncbi:hypothetical protein PVAP13_9KG067000 [Panicum virgatum]|uniref:Uncharacterized protein n=2 Tax=Panicum virgatum TaxID=38727 RepID=A0A8T0NAS8_PANVG|nr:hypothetical protein PVAP13_9KG067000 [Panicum virgatum]
MKPPVPTSKSTASMVDDPFVVLDTASASGSASLGRSANPLEDLEKPANSEGFQALDEQYYNSWLHRFSDEELLLCVCLLEFVFLLYQFLNLP